MLDTLPSEIISMAAFFACTDGGFTGGSLARISRHIRDATRVARFYTVALAEDPKQVTDFLACYRSEVSRVHNNRPRVRHLFLSLFGRSTAFRLEHFQLEMGAAPSGGDRRQAMFAALAQFSRDQNNDSEQYAHVVPTLMEEVAPDLYTLALLQSKFYTLPTAIVEFTALKELILVGGDPRFRRFNKLGRGDSGEPQPPLYPSLRRLHHILQWQLAIRDDVDFEPWSKHAPNLTHLRVSRLHQTPPVTIDTLIRSYSKVSDDQVLFPHLEAVLIQPKAAPREDDHLIVHLVSNHTVEAHATMMERLEAGMAQTRVETTILNDWVDSDVSVSQDIFGDTAQKVRDEWHDRVVGGAGCWLESLPTLKVVRPGE